MCVCAQGRLELKRCAVGIFISLPPRLVLASLHLGGNLAAAAVICPGLNVPSVGWWQRSSGRCLGCASPSRPRRSTTATPAFPVKPPTRLCSSKSAGTRPRPRLWTLDTNGVERMCRHCFGRSLSSKPMCRDCQRPMDTCLQIHPGQWPPLGSCQTCSGSTSPPPRRLRPSHRHRHSRPWTWTKALGPARDRWNTSASPKSKAKSRASRNTWWNWSRMHSTDCGITWKPRSPPAGRSSRPSCPPDRRWTKP